MEILDRLRTESGIRKYLLPLIVAAGFLYFFRLGQASLGSSEAYSALISCGGDYRSVIRSTMLYTHLAAAIILAGEAAIVLRDLWFRRRTMPAIAALAGTILLFVPYTSIALGQTQGLLFGHWLDWIGRRQSSFAWSHGLLAVL